MASTTATPGGAQVYNSQSGTWSAFQPPAAAAPTTVPTYQNTVLTDPTDPGSAITPTDASGFNTQNPAATPAAPINRSVAAPGATSPTGDPATDYLNTFTPPQTQEQIADQLRQQSQGLIDSTNKQYDDQVATDTAAGQDRLNQNNSVSVMSGLTGSTAAIGTQQKVTDANGKVIAADNDNRALALQTIYSKISSDAATQAEQQKQDATKSAEDIVAQRTTDQANALKNVQALAAAGTVDFQSFSTNPANAQVYNYALQAAGGSPDVLAGIFAASRPKDSLVGTPQRVGDHYVQAYQNALTGKVSYDTVQVPGGIPANYNTFQTIGDAANGQRIYAIPDNWNGDTSQLKLIASTAGTNNGGGAGGNTVPVVGPGGKTANVPVDVAPYYNVSNSGVPYADLSTVQGTATEKEAIVNAAQSAGIKVITNKNTALDLTNITDANSKLDSISTIMAGIDQPDALSRDLAGFGLTKFATMAQSNPQQAASGALQGVGLDILKAISGVQGFRGNTAVIQQITDHLPSIYDTQDVVNDKVTYIRTLISDRENAILGAQPGGSTNAPAADTPSPATAAIGSTVTINGAQYKKTAADAYQPL